MADSLYEYEELAKLSRPPAPTVDDEGDVLSVGVDGEGRPRYQLEEVPNHTHSAEEIEGLSDYVPIPGVYPNGASQSINWANGVWQEINATGNLAIEFSGTPPVGVWLRIRVNAGAADRTVTMPTGVLFSYDVASVVIPAGYTKTFIGLWDGGKYEFGYTEDRGVL